MFLRPNRRSKDGKDHTYWSLVETVRTPDGPRQKTLCYLGELNASAQTRWLKTIEVFNEQGEVQQLKLFPSHVEGQRMIRRWRACCSTRCDWSARGSSEAAGSAWNSGDISNWTTSSRSRR